MTMQVIKPTRLSLISKTYALKGHIFAVGAMSFFKLGKDNRLLSENQQWPRLTRYLNAGLILDIGYAKPCGEMLASGAACAADKQAVKKMTVGVSVGKLDKQLKVVGDRHWDGGILSPSSVITPFASMPLTFAQAYGGADHPENPLGKGLINPQQKDPDSGLYRLPNVYDQKDSTAADRDYRIAASFEPLGISWPQRSRFQGTYDEHWLNSVHPGFPDDTDSRLFNAAPADQQINGFFKPGQHYQIKGMHPEHELIEGQLPGVRARVFATQLVDGVEQFKEIDTVIDTLWFFPELELGIAIHRGTLAVNDSDGLDIKKLLLAYEGVADKPRAVGYFEKVQKLRLDPKTAAGHLLNESQLMAQKSPQQVAEIDALYAEAKARQLAKNRQQTAARLDWLKQQNPQLAEIDLPLPDLAADVDQFPPLPQVLVDSGDIDLAPYLEKAQLQVAEAQSRAEQVLAEQQQMIKQQAEKAKTETKSADSMAAMVKQVVHIVATGLADEVEIAVPGWMAYMPPDSGVLQQFRQAELIKLKTARQARQLAPVNTVLQPPLPDGGPAQLRRAVLALLDGNSSLAGRDLAGADLSGMDLSAQDLRDVMFEGADLTGCNFSGSQLDGAVFTGARLHYADFSDCSMQQANLALCHGKETHFNRANLTQATLTQGHFIRCDFTEATLNNIQAIETDFSHSCLQRLHCDAAQFIQVNLSHSNARQASISNCVFMETELIDADWQQANLTRLIMIKTTARGTNFCGMVADRVQFSNEGDFSQVDISSGHWLTCGFRGLDLSDCDAAATVFEQCDFGETRLNNGRLSDVLFDKCVMALAVFDGSDCRQSFFHESRLRKCRFNRVDLSDCELYNCDVSEVMFNDCKTKGFSQKPLPSIS